MKASLRLLLSAALLCSICITTSFGKGYSVPVHSKNIVKYDTLTTVVQLQVSNISSSNLTIKYTIISDGFAFSGWGYNFCDLNSCFTSAYQNNNADGLTAKDTSAFSITINSFRGHPQTENMTIKIWDVNDPNHPDTLSMTIDGTKMGVETQLLPASFVDLFPNPATNYVSLRVSQQGFEPVKATVFNSLGKTISVQSISGETNSLPVFDLPNGVYIISLRDQYGREARKQFIKE
jgi:hypothetical protein